jgi:hypothetical protein
MSVTTNTPFGFRYYKSLLGADTQEVLNTYIWNDTTTGIYEGDPVALAAATANAPVNGYKRITIAPADGAVVGILGIARGVKYIDEQGNPRFTNFFAANTPIKANTVVEVLVSDDPNTIYMVQAAAAIANNRMSYNTTIANMGTGDASGQSQAVITATGLAQTAALPIKIVGYVAPEKFPGNVNTAAFPVMLVKLNNHTYGSAVSGF